MKPDFEYNFIARKRGEKYQLILSYKDATGKWRQKSRIVEKAADARSNIIRAEMLKDVAGSLELNTAYKDITLKDFAAFYATQRTDLAITTHLAYIQRVGMLTALKDMKIRDITYMDISAQFSTLKHSERTTEALLSTLKALLKAAVRFRVISASPAADFVYKSKKQNKPRRPRTFTPEEMDKLDEKVRNPAVKIILAICRYTGCRVGEALGITWKDIDLLRLSIQINKQYGVIATNPAVYGMKPVKNANGNRTVYIPPALLEHLQQYKKVAPLTIDGRLTTLRHVQQINNAIKAKVPGHSVHDYRHTFATKLLNEGINIRTIAALLGDTVVTVEHTYLDFTAEMRENVRTLLKDIEL